ncbi:hypothetical protein ACLOJK_003846 [Asimina triloba]
MIPIAPQQHLLQISATKNPSSSPSFADLARVHLTFNSYGSVEQGHVQILNPPIAAHPPFGEHPIQHQHDRRKGRVWVERIIAVSPPSSLISMTDQQSSKLHGTMANDE